MYNMQNCHMISNIICRCICRNTSYIDLCQIRQDPDLGFRSSTRRMQHMRFCDHHFPYEHCHKLKFKHVDLENPCLNHVEKKTFSEMFLPTLFLDNIK